MLRTCVVASLLVCGGFVGMESARAEPLAESYLMDGKLADGERDLEQRLKLQPNDDQARFGLGVVQFLHGFEQASTVLYKYGVRTERGVGGAMPPELREMLKQNPNPEAISYTAVRQEIQAWVDQLNRAEATLAAVKDDSVKLPLHVAKIRLDLFGLGKPVSASMLFGRVEGGPPPEMTEQFVIDFDRGDVCWLRGYCHFMAAWGEMLLAVDSQELFDCTAHLFFEKVETPHKFLQEEPREVFNLFNGPSIGWADIIAFIHLWRFPVKEPARMQAALEHLEAMTTMSQEMWKFYLAETDNESEWIPNPKQHGVMQIQVTQEMVDTWLEVVSEAKEVLAGKKLVPFWRGTQRDRGVNLRRVFTEPRTLDPILWVQGTAATPYLENGPLTKFADPRTFDKISDTFGGPQFFGFAFWFN